MSQSRSSATVQDLMTADVAVYQDRGGPELGSPWQTVPPEKFVDKKLADAMAHYGYFGKIYLNPQTGEVIIANRGTQNGANFVSDVGVALGEVANAQPIADEFARRGLIAAERLLSDAGVGLSAVYTTGHSLGGAEAEGQAQMLSLETGPGALVPPDVHITHFSIDAPGVGERAHQGDQSRYTSYNVSSQGDVVHKAGGDQLDGTLEISLPIGPRIMQTEGMMIAGAALAAELPLVGVPMLAAGAQQALEAHKSTLILDHVKGTALGDMKVAELGTSANDILAAFKTKATKASDATPVTAQAQADSLAANDAQVAESHADDRNIWGLDRKGGIDPAALSGPNAQAYVERWLDANGYQPKPRMQYKIN